MIRNTITILALSAGLGGMIALAPAPAQSGFLISTAPVAEAAQNNDELKAKYDALRAELEALKAAYKKAESSYEKNEIKSRGKKLQAAIEKMKKESQRGRVRARSGGRGVGGGIARTAPDRKRDRSAVGQGRGGARSLSEGQRDRIRAELQALAEKAEYFEQQGQMAEAQAIRERLIEARKRIEMGRALGRARADAPDRARHENEVRRELETMVRKAKQLEADGQHERAGAIVKRLKEAEKRIVASTLRRADSRQNQIKARDVRRKLSAIRKKSVELEQQGSHEEAEALRHEAREIQRKVERAIVEREARRRPPRPVRAPRADRVPSPPDAPQPRRGGFGQTPRLERTPGPDAVPFPDPRPHGRAELRRSPRPPVAPGPAEAPDALHADELKSRIQHMINAAENLHAAGMHDQAMKLQQQAESMAAKARQAMAARRNLSSGGSRIDREVDALRDEVTELRAIMHELMKRVEAYHADRE